MGGIRLENCLLNTGGLRSLESSWGVVKDGRHTGGLGSHNNQFKIIIISICVYVMSHGCG